MKFYETADGIIDLDAIDVKLELVTPEIAKNYLSCNFKNNRLLRKNWVKELSVLIKKKEFNLSWDCISFDDKGQPLVYPRYEDTTSGFVAPLLKGAMLAATIYGGYGLAQTFATKGFSVGVKQVGKKLLKKQLSKALSRD